MQRSLSKEKQVVEEFKHRMKVDLLMIVVVVVVVVVATKVQQIDKGVSRPIYINIDNRLT